MSLIFKHIIILSFITEMCCSFSLHAFSLFLLGGVILHNRQLVILQKFTNQDIVRNYRSMQMGFTICSCINICSLFTLIKRIQNVPFISSQFLISSKYYEFIKRFSYYKLRYQSVGFFFFTTVFWGIKFLCWSIVYRKEYLKFYGCFGMICIYFKSVFIQKKELLIVYRSILVLIFQVYFKQTLLKYTIYIQNVLKLRVKLYRNGFDIYVDLRWLKTLDLNNKQTRSSREQPAENPGDSKQI
eukprot:TRINITY_DN94504_c0_g1_i3.p2 TRINITY_DN94504_c0_g1~~TRINITY_DN94504_c0_g1_i3.p2  ORF type:complete len:242 (+),score=-2.70 TRINITY_DN94504_c0_g1_i3:340-1065(+)